MTLDFRTRYGDIPVRLVARDGIGRAAKRGVVVMYHGLGSEIGAQTLELHGLAARGFLAVGVDNIGHGRRRAPDFDRRFSGEGSDRRFVEAVDGTARELPELLNALHSQGLRWTRVGVTGISMGGYIAFQTRLYEPRVRALVPILGNPRWKFPEPVCAWSRPEHFPPVALYAWNAELDESVPPRFARDFLRVLGPLYREIPERLRYEEVAGAGHLMNDVDWRRMWRRTEDWFVEHLM